MYRVIMYNSSIRSIARDVLRDSLKPREEEISKFGVEFNKESLGRLYPHIIYLMTNQALKGKQIDNVYTLIPLVHPIIEDTDRLLRAQISPEEKLVWWMSAYKKIIREHGLDIKPESVYKEIRYWSQI